MCPELKIESSLLCYDSDPLGTQRPLTFSKYEFQAFSDPKPFKK